MKLICTYCKEHFSGIAAIRDHTCPVVEQRVRALPSDLSFKVCRGGMKLEKAEQEAAKRPRIKL